MAFKMKGSPVIQGTAKHSALKLGIIKNALKEKEEYRKEHWGMNEAELTQFFKEKGDKMDAMFGGGYNVSKEDYVSKKSTKKKKGKKKKVETEKVAPTKLIGLVKNVVKKIVKKKAKKVTKTKVAKTPNEIERDRLLERFKQSIKDPVIKQ